MKREIVELDDLLLIEAEHVAKQNGKSLSGFMSDALRQHVDSNRKPTRLSFIGMFEGDARPSEPEDLDMELREGIDPHEGWSHDPWPVPADDRRQASS
jgi:hypothetical protein